MPEPKEKLKSKAPFVVKTVSEDGTTSEKTYYVVRPTRKDIQDAETERSRVFTNLFRSKTLLDREVENLARERNLWDDSREEETQEIMKQIRERVLLINGFTKGTTKAAARAAAIEIRKLRSKMMQIGAERRALNTHTAESKAKDVEFNFLMVRCVRDADNKPVYSSVEDMLANEDSGLFEAAYDAFLKLHYGLDVEQTNRDLPENKFLLANGYCDESLRLIDPVTKKYVDVEGNFINQEGRRVNADGLLVDNEGNVIDEEGLPVAERYPLID